ncbi:hypothetical protein B0O80DRAFT_436389 [Mortierella sp. GBAus27b]|nr:hypothetical protein B0O80DRAFT_436389 [Mortierella sp. GBAus27b]
MEWRKGGNQTGVGERWGKGAKKQCGGKSTGELWEERGSDGCRCSEIWKGGRAGV